MIGAQARPFAAGLHIRGVETVRRATFADSAILGAIIKANKQAGRRCFAVILPQCYPPAPAERSTAHAGVE